jgi:2-polyprenyl-3-methyl-5-hydroxy-6-metoxy-1,4-benzoquinol methylase
VPYTRTLPGIIKCEMVVKEMGVKNDKIGIDYNSIRKAEPYLTKRLNEHLNPNKDGTYLDIGCGTGNYTMELEKNGLR